MGCLKRIFSIVILVFAYIGFQSVGGVKWVQDTYSSWTNPSEEKTIESVNHLIDTSNLSNDFEISKSLNFFGMKVIEADYTKSPQKVFIIDSNGMIKLSKEDFSTGKIEEILQNLISKFTYQAVRIENLKITRFGHFMAMNDQKIPYIIFEADIIRGTAPKMYGMLGVVESPERENDIILSFTTVGKYNQKVTERFFREVNYSEGK